MSQLRSQRHLDKAPAFTAGNSNHPLHPLNNYENMPFNMPRPGSCLLIFRFNRTRWGTPPPHNTALNSGLEVFFSGSISRRYDDPIRRQI
ncbi:hypothetical protein RRG08_041123 [Elysia crispata]|uniref:Uncharacterized protein n=1 Tax=Elysia crispata TaxID=231223 RepID=A0AAE1CP03_9GAST|nr:hypothetical protein RRG08_041123 [Elysia crispata]